MYDRPLVYEIDGGREVVVKIRREHAKRYPKGTRTNLNGVRGYVVHCNELSMWGAKPPSRSYKVRFSRPVKAWWGRFRINAWWFSPEDLRKTNARQDQCNF